MEMLFSTKQVHPRDRFAYWHDVACKVIVNHQSRPQNRSSFHAQIESALLTEIKIVQFENSPMEVVRGPRHVAREQTDDLFMCRQIAGTLALEQENRELVLEAGDMVLLDPMLPYRGKFCSASELLVLKIPRRLLQARVGDVAETIARLLKPVEVEYDFTSSFLAMLPTYVGRMSAATEAIAANHALDLISMSLAKLMEGFRPRLSSARRLALSTVRAVIEARLTDPSLDPDTVAAAAGISVRYANAVLARENTSIARLVQARRLARCRGALEDQSQWHRTISEIAFGWGFSDMTHFGRRFKKAYGMSPREYRAAHRVSAKIRQAD